MPSDGVPSDPRNQSTGPHPWARSGVLLARIAQWTCAAFAFVITGGALSANVNVLNAAALGVFALVTLAFVGVLELLAVKPIRRRWLV